MFETALTFLKILAKHAQKSGLALAIYGLCISGMAHGITVKAQAGGCYSLEGEHAAQNAPYESGVELEIQSTKGVFELLTTLDGTIAPIIDGIPIDDLNISPSISDKIAKDGAKSVAWDSLGYVDKKNVINAAARYRGQDFWRSRKIQGLTVKSTAEIRFDQPTEFLGKLYPAGQHRINLGRFLEPDVEFQNASDVDRLSQVEIKIRSSLPAGKLGQSARTLQEYLGVHKHQHIHIVSRLDKQALRADPIVEPARYAEFFRRVNLLAEMYCVVEESVGLRVIEGGGVTYFDSASQQLMAGVGLFFSEVAQGRNPTIKDQFKMGMVGFRGTDTYDQPNLFGIEYRSVNPDSNLAKLGVVLDKVQSAMVTGEFGLPRSTIETWIKSMPKPDQLGGAVMGIWYQQPFETLFANAHPKVKAAIKSAELDATSLEKQFSKRGKEARMLFFNWSFDPVVAGRPELLNRIVDAQVAAISELTANQGSKTLVVKTFLEDSGLYQRVLETFSIPFN